MTWVKAKIAIRWAYTRELYGAGMTPVAHQIRTSGVLRCRSSSPRTPRAEERIPATRADWRGELFQQVGSGVVVYRALPGGRDFMVVDINAAAERIERIDRSQVVGRRVTEVFPGVAEFGLLDVLRRVWRSGVAENHPLRLYHDDRITGWRENHVFRASTGEVVAVYEDRTSQVTTEEAQAHQAVISAELNHRLKNLLALTKAMVSGTLRSSSSLDQFAELFGARLDAMARGNDLLLKAAGAPVEMGQVIRSAVAAFGPGIQLSPPRRPVWLTAKAVSAITLVIHELATNAAKYGALTRPEGKIRLQWRADGRHPRWVACRWTESGGPGVVAPTHKGFGSRLIEGAVKADLRGELSLSYPTSGLECAIRFPVAADIPKAAPPARFDG